MVQLMRQTVARDPASTAECCVRERKPRAAGWHVGRLIAFASRTQLRIPTEPLSVGNARRFGCGATRHPCIAHSPIQIHLCLALACRCGKRSAVAWRAAHVSEVGHGRLLRLLDLVTRGAAHRCRAGVGDAAAEAELSA